VRRPGISIAERARGVTDRLLTADEVAELLAVSVNPLSLHPLVFREKQRDDVIAGRESALRRPRPGLIEREGWGSPSPRPAT
jgi:hypothetical protein